MWQNVMVDVTTLVCAHFMNTKQIMYSKTLNVIFAWSSVDINFYLYHKGLLQSCSERWRVYHKMEDYYNWC